KNINTPLSKVFDGIGLCMKLIFELGNNELLSTFESFSYIKNGMLFLKSIFKKKIDWVFFDELASQRHGLSLGFICRDGEGVSAGLGGPGGDAEPLDEDGSAPESFASPARDLPGDHRGLRLCVARHGAQQREQRAGTHG